MAAREAGCVEGGKGSRVIRGGNREEGRKGDTCREGGVCVKGKGG